MTDTEAFGHVVRFLPVKGHMIYASEMDALRIRPNLDASLTSFPNVSNSALQTKTQPRSLQI